LPVQKSRFSGISKHKNQTGNRGIGVTVLLRQLHVSIWLSSAVCFPGCLQKRVETFAVIVCLAKQQLKDIQ